ncbi:MAG: hypothetical protein PHU95_02270 [Candidatus Thermoplasmatota archaeon]|nr:hypothetical protein [Candidatus Thermoplasmatota archaeon]MDD5778257.1 hypothetical protein [Candidatus Thermoplasmatota archaeon]
MQPQPADIRGMVDISGMGGSYEETCQRMLQQGWEWLNEHKGAELKAHAFKGVYGLIVLDTEETKALSEAVTKGSDATGAMHQAVMSHLLYISKHGLKEWEEAAQRRDAHD